MDWGFYWCCRTYDANLSQTPSYHAFMVQCFQERKITPSIIIGQSMKTTMHRDTTRKVWDELFLWFWQYVRFPVFSSDADQHFHHSHLCHQYLGLCLQNIDILVCQQPVIPLVVLQYFWIVHLFKSYAVSEWRVITWQERLVIEPCNNCNTFCGVCRIKVFFHFAVFHRYWLDGVIDGRNGTWASGVCCWMIFLSNL